MRKVRIVPAMLTDDAAAFKRMAGSIKGATDWVQVDIMDGEFVPSCSINWQAVKAAKLPFNWEAHLMVKNPETYFSGFKCARAQRVIFHFEAVTEPTAVIAAARKLDLEVGMAINPETAVAAIAEYLPLLDSILILSVNPGFYGAKYIPDVLNKVGELRAIAPDIKIAIDGGVKEDNILEVAASGVDDICVGSGIFRAAEPAASCRRLQAMVDAASG